MLTHDEDGEEEEEDVNSFRLIILFLTHFVFFLAAILWIYPPDEPPNNARIRKIPTQVVRSQITGEPIRPGNRLTVAEISKINRQHQKNGGCHERGYLLSEDDQKTLAVVKDGDVNFLRHQSKLMQDLTLNYGNLIINRAPGEADITKSVKDMAETGGAVVDTLAPLKRPKELEKEKKKKNKERMDALDKLTRGDSKEHQKLFNRIMPDRHGNSRKKPRAPSTGRTFEVSMTPSVTPSDDQEKTNQRLRKLQPSKGFRNLPALNETMHKTVSDDAKKDVKKKTSSDDVKRDVKKKTSVTRKDDEKTLAARTAEENTAVTRRLLL